MSRPCLGTQTEYECEDDDEDDMKIAPSGKEIQDELAQAVASAIKDGIFLCVEADSGLVGCGGGGRGMKKLECRM